MSESPVENPQEVIAAVEAVRQQRGVSRHQLADELGIPFDTFRKWFRAAGNKVPSHAHLTRLRTFVAASVQSRRHGDDLVHAVRDWWRTQHRYESLEQLANELGWTVDGLRSCLEAESVPPRLVLERLAQIIQLPIVGTTFSFEEARRRSERLKGLLLILADELAWFRDGPPQARETVRSELDCFDAGYVSTLLTMLFSEDKFRRWLQLTTYRFNYFKVKGQSR
jgi:transcriptional regulator with XRE-family HTH domain